MTEFRDLQLLMTLADELHFGRAAEKLGCTQPQLSVRVARLEEQLGAVLFTRRPRVALTSAGRIVVDAARRSQAEFFSAVRRAKTVSESAPLVLGFTSTAMFTRLPEVLRDFRRAISGLQLRLRQMHSGELWQALGAGIVDVAITRESAADASIVSSVLFSEPFLVGMPASHRATSEQAVDLADLAQDSFVLFHRAAAPRLHAQIVGLCAHAGFEPDVTEELDDWPTILALVRADFGVTILPESATFGAVEGAVFKEISSGAAITDTFVCYRRSNEHAAAGALVNWLREASARLISR